MDQSALTSAIESWVLANAGTLQYGLFFGLFFIFALVGTRTPVRFGPMHRRRRWLDNLVLTALNVAVLSAIPVTFFTGAIWAAKADFGLLQFIPLPVWLAIPATLLLRGFISFFTHFLAHKVPWLWRVHRVHHFDTELDMSTTVRFHPLEFIINLVIGLPIVVLLGLLPWVLLLYELLDVGVTLFSHANIRIPGWLNRPLRYVIVTPDLHRVHHSSWQPETDSNVSAVFPVWDILFGTFRTHTRQPQETMVLGLENMRDDRTHRIGWLLASPARDLKTEPPDRSRATDVGTGPPSQSPS